MIRLFLLFILFSSCRTKQPIIYSNLRLVTHIDSLAKISAKEGDIVYMNGEYGGLFTFSPKKSSQFSFKFPNSEMSWNRVIEKPDELNVAWFGANCKDEQDDTQQVQETINALPDYGGKIIIPRGCKFLLNKLNFPQNVELDYYATSDKSIDSGEIKVTNEKVAFMANANHEGIVNEEIFAAPFHPGFIINVKKEIGGQKPYLGSNQSLDNPVRASFIIQDEGMNQVIQQYIAYPDFDNPYSGWRVGLNRNTYKLKGISEKDFQRRLNIGDLIISKKGKGHLVELGKDFILLQWFSGRFSSGESIETSNGNKCNKKLMSIEFSSIPFNALSLDKRSGYIGIGIPNANAIHPLTVGGKIGIQSTRQHGQYVPFEHNNPALVFSPSFEAKVLKGLQIKLIDERNNNRLVISDIKDKANIAHLGAVRAHTAFTKTIIASTTSFNIKNIERVAQGSYKITFITPFERADYQVGISSSRALEYPYVYSKTCEQIIINIVKTGTENSVNPDGEISIICTGGDY